MSRKILKNNSGSIYGTMGEKTNHKNIHVGDLVVVERYGGSVYSGIIVKYNNEYFKMGAVGTLLKDYRAIHKVLPHELVTDEILDRLHSLHISEPKKMTLDEIQKKLGYEIEIIE